MLAGVGLVAGDRAALRPRLADARGRADERLDLRRAARRELPPRRVVAEDLLVSNAPPVEALGIPPRSMSQQSHIRISPDQYARAVEAIASVAAG